MNHFVRCGLITWCLLQAGAVLAEERKGGPPSGRPAESQHGAAEHVERASKEMKEAAKAAQRDAREAAQAAEREAREAAQAAEREARQALEQAGRELDKASHEANEAFEHAKVQVQGQLSDVHLEAQKYVAAARENARQALLAAAERLKADEPESQDRAGLEQRKNQARRERWLELRARMKPARSGEPAHLDQAMKNELARHAQRTAHLARIRALAEQDGDKKSVARCDELLELELSHHERRMQPLLAGDSKDETAGQRAETDRKEHAP